LERGVRTRDLSPCHVARSSNLPVGPRAGGRDLGGSVGTGLLNFPAQPLNRFLGVRPLSSPFGSSLFGAALGSGEFLTGRGTLGFGVGAALFELAAQLLHCLLVGGPLRAAFQFGLRGLCFCGAALFTCRRGRPCGFLGFGASQRSCRFGVELGHTAGDQRARAGRVHSLKD
jgi:hypothetical protein